MSNETMMCRHDLNTIEGISLGKLYSQNGENKNDIDALSNNLNIKTKLWRHKDNSYSIIRYDKSMLSKDRWPTIGLLRSVIAKDKKVLCFSPPKSISYDNFKQTAIPESIVANEYVEGTMINMFYTGSEWEIATRSSVGGNVSFYAASDGTPTKTFRWMFLDAVSHCETLSEDPRDLFSCVETFPKTYCFSFILQHPDNRIVVPFQNPNVYLAKIYNIQSNYVEEVPITNEVTQLLPVWLCYPQNVNKEYQWLEYCFRDGCETDYKIVGAMLSGRDSNNNVIRTKIRNPNYESVRQLRGNQPKLQYRYLMLRKARKVADYLKYYPEHRTLFDSYRKLIHKFTKELHTNYIMCYVKKSGPLNTFSPQYRTHMFKLHEEYKTNLSSQQKVVTRNVVIDYVNNLHPNLLMHACNYHYKQAKKEMAAVQSSNDVSMEDE